MRISITGITHSFGNHRALDGVTLTIEPGELVALLGPSGCGKTTLLRIIAGLESPDSGTIHLDEIDVTRQPAQRRGVGFVFQHYALFRHLSVFENVAFGLRVRPRRERPPEAAIRTRVHELLTLVQLDDVARRLPSQLSGGQRQRVALARALAVEPRVLLLDEPFGALDAKVRRDLRRWLRRLHERLRITTLFVTHDQEEALELADRVVIINQGRIEQAGSPDEVYSHPGSPFVLHFLGEVNLFHCRVADGLAFVGDTPFELDGRHFEADDGEVPSDNAGGGPHERSGVLYVRPHALAIHDEPVARAFPATVLRVVPAGSVTKIDLETPAGEPVRVEAAGEQVHALGLIRGATVFLRPTGPVTVVPSEEP